MSARLGGLGRDDHDRHFQPHDGPNRCIGCGVEDRWAGELCGRDRCPECCEASECHVVCTNCDRAVDPLAACEHRLCVDCGECGHGAHGGCDECGACAECDEERAIDRDVARTLARRAREERDACALEDLADEMRERDLMEACRVWREERDDVRASGGAA